MVSATVVACADVAVPLLKHATRQRPDYSRSSPRPRRLALILRKPGQSHAVRLEEHDALGLDHSPAPPNAFVEFPAALQIFHAKPDDPHAPFHLASLQSTRGEQQRAPAEIKPWPRFPRPRRNYLHPALIRACRPQAALRSATRLPTARRSATVGGARADRTTRAPWPPR
jgi:hypothetical protein